MNVIYTVLKTLVYNIDFDVPVFIDQVLISRVYTLQIVHTATSKKLFYIHVFYVFYLSNNFMYFTFLITYHNRRHTSNFNQEQTICLVMTH
jgi:hypothetical protein